MGTEPLIKLPDGIGFDTAAEMTMRGLTTSYLLRRIASLSAVDTVLMHAAAGGVGLIFNKWASELGFRVIGTAVRASTLPVGERVTIRTFRSRLYLEYTSRLPSRERAMV